MAKYYKLVKNFEYNEIPLGTVLKIVREDSYTSGTRLKGWGLFYYKGRGGQVSLPMKSLEKATEKEYFQSKLKYG